MQERSHTLPMCSVDRSSYVPSAPMSHHSGDSQLSAAHETDSSSSSSTPELNLLLDKLTEILRFRSGCRRHSALNHQAASQPASASTNNLKRLQSGSIEPLHNTADVTLMTSNGSGSSPSSSAWKSSASHHKSSISTRSSHHSHSHHHHHHSHHQTNLSVHIHNLEKKRRLPSLLQRLIDEGNLIKEAVRRLKTQRFSQAFKQQSSNIANTPSTPTTKASAGVSNAFPLPGSSSSSSIALAHGTTQISDPPSQTTASPNRGISWFLSSSVFGVNAAATTNHSSGSGSPLRACYSSSTHDRTPMEIGIHEG